VSTITLVLLFVVLVFSSSCSLADIAKSWSDSCAMASSFILSRFLNDWFSSSSSSTLLCISAPCPRHAINYKKAGNGQFYGRISIVIVAVSVVNLGPARIRIG
jgi:hypothetical protein